MGRAPCCEKMGLKKGPWSSEEDQILINYIQSHGHANWRALPKQAGLLRCGKSCRLRWTNYLRPDIKRGNFTPEEEQTIFHLHHLLGNRWSAIAARLPGRTDNEIKNVWHTHLKKRLPHNQQNLPSNRKHKVLSPVTTSSANNDNVPQSPPQCSMSISDTSTLTDTGNMEPNNENMFTNNIDMLTHINNNIETLDDDFWSEVLSADNSNQSCQLDSAAAYAAADDIHFPFALSPFTTGDTSTDIVDAFNMDFWGDHQVLTELSSPQL